MTTLFCSIMIHIALVILSLFAVSSEQMTVLLNKSYKNTCSHFQIQNNLISYLCFFDINTSNFSSTNHHLSFLAISIPISISHTQCNTQCTLHTVTVLFATTSPAVWRYIHSVCHSTLSVVLPSHETETELNTSLTKCLTFTYLQKVSKQRAQNEYCVMLETVLLRIKLDVPCHSQFVLTPGDHNVQQWAPNLGK
jgi:hypothetical protein